MRICFFIFMVLGGLVAPLWAGEPMAINIDPSPIEISTAKVTVHFEVEIADSDIERASGLMFRTDFPQNKAMLFDFQQTRIVSMWMKNTPLPLDMLFVEENGLIIHIAENTVPQDLTVISSLKPVRFVLEINAGQVALNNIRIGDRLLHPTFKN